MEQTPSLKGEALLPLPFQGRGPGGWVPSADGTGRQYYTQLADLLTEACQRAPRNLTQAEWAQFIKDEPYRATCEGCRLTR